MPAFNIASDELLILIWQTSLTFVIFSILVFVWIVIKRFISDRKKSKAHDYKRNLSKYLYAAISSPIAITADTLPKISDTEKSILLEASLDLLRPLRGGDRQKIIELLKVWGMQEYLLRVIKTGRRGKKIQALTLLSDFKNKHAFRALTRYAASRDIYIQLAALRGLSSYGKAYHLKRIIHSLTKTRNTNKLMLADILGRYQSDAAPSIMALTKPNIQTDIRLAAIIALSKIKSIDTVPDLIDLLNDENTSIVAEAATTLGVIGDIQAENMLIKTLSHRSGDARIQAAEALGRLRSEKALPRLVDMLNDTNWWARLRAAQALYKMGDRGITTLKSQSNKNNNAGLIAQQYLKEMETEIV